MKFRDIFHHPGWLIVLPAIAFFLGLGSFPLFDLDEGAFSAATWEMLQRGDFVTTYLNGEPRFDKPILIYWFQAASVSLIGVNEWGFRIPSAIFSTLWMWSIYRFVLEYFDHERAMQAFWMATTSLVILVIGRAATADALLNLLITLSLFDIYRYFQRPDAALIRRTFLWMGLGFLTKGPVAIVVPLIVTLLFCTTQRRWSDLGKALLNPTAWGIFVAVVAPWYILEYRDQGQAFIDGFFLKHNVGRFSSTMENHGGSILYYLPVLFLITMPYAGLLITAARNIRSNLSEPMTQFMLYWFGFVFLFFSFSNTQLPHYLLYGTIPLFILMVMHKDMWVSRFWILVWPTLFVSLLAALPFVVNELANLEDHPYRKEVLNWGSGQFDLGYFLSVSLLLTVVLLGWVVQKRTKLPMILAAGLVQSIFVTQWLIPVVAKTQQTPVVEAAKASEKLEGRLVMSGVNMPSITIYREQITPKQKPIAGDWVFTRVGSKAFKNAESIAYQKCGIAIIKAGES